MTLLCCTTAAFAIDANDFAVQWLEYDSGSDMEYDFVTGQPLNNPDSAIGRPQPYTTGDGWYIPVNQNVPVVPVAPAFRRSEIMTIGPGGHLIIKFDHPVANDRNNPHGIDLIIFGNARQLMGMGQTWTNGNPEDTTVTGSIYAEPATVAVSQTGGLDVNDWHYFTNGPYADTFAPPAGFEWDGQNWGAELDPLKPVDPNLTAVDMAGLNVAEMIDLYQGAAGGTGFDIGSLGLDWIMYVKIENYVTSPYTTEIDAFTDVTCYGDYKNPFGDLDGNQTVDYFDLAILRGYWLAQITGPEDPAAIADIYKDQADIVNFCDFALLAESWGFK